MKQCIQALFMILESIQSKYCYEVISIYYPKNFINEDLIEVNEIDPFNNLIYNLLQNNKLRKFNFILFSPDIFNSFCSKILLDAIYNNEELRVVNGFNLKDYMENYENAFNLAYKYYGSTKSMLAFQEESNELKFRSEEFHEYMPIVLSELTKTFQLDGISKFVKKIFDVDSYITCKSLDLTKLTKGWKENSIFKYNMIGLFVNLEELIICFNSPSLNEIYAIEDKIIKLENLQKIKCSFRDSIDYDDLTFLLEAKNLSYLQINGYVELKDTESFSEKIKSSKIEKLVLKNISLGNRECYGNEAGSVYFGNTIETLFCESLKVLKVYINYTPDYLDALIQKLNKLTNLEYFGISLSRNNANFNNSIKNLISIIQCKETKLSRFKVHKFIWDIENIQRENYLNFTGKRLNPADLMVLAVLCEERIIKDVICVDISENIGIVDSGFVESMVKIINILGCNEVIMKNSGCELNHVEKIISSLGNLKSSTLSIRIF